MNAAYFDFAVDLVVNTSAIFLLAYALYFRRHRRADLLLGYVALNMGIFVAMSLLTTVRLDIALGFGLFAILSIIRLRSTSVTQQEVAYYFVALVMGLVNGMDIPDRRLVVLINALLLTAMAVVDSKALRERTRRLDVHLDAVHVDDASLVADLERLLTAWGQPSFRARQVFRQLYRQLADDPRQMSDLPLALRERLVDRCPGLPDAPAGVLARRRRQRADLPVGERER